MLRNSRSRVVSLMAAAMLLLGSVSAVNAAGRPSGQYSLTACWDGTTVSMTQTWSGAIVDGYSFGFGNSEGGLGVATTLPHPARKGSVSSITADSALTVPPEATFVAGGVTFRDQTVGSAQIDVPTGGWSALATC